MTVNNVLKHYGQNATLSDTSTNTAVDFKAFVQALRYKNKLYLRGTYTELGRNQQDYYLYIGPADIDISGADSTTKILTVGGISYIVDRVEKHYIGRQLIYHWAIIHPSVADES